MFTFCKCLKGGRAILLGLVMALTAALWLMGCEKKEEPVAGVPVAVPQPEPVKPAAVEVLQLMPEAAMVASAIPSPVDLYDKCIAHAKRVSPNPAQLETTIADAVQQTATDWGVPEAKSFEEIARAKGIDPKAALGIFVDFTPMEPGITAAATQLMAASEAYSPSGDATAAPPPSGDVTSPEASEKEPAACTAMAPAIALVIPCLDAKLAEASMKEVFGRLAAAVGRESKFEQIEAEGIAIQWCDLNKLAYFVAGNRLIAGNSLELVKGVAARLRAPATVRYGTEECPIRRPDEAVALVRMDKLVPWAHRLSSTLITAYPMAAGWGAWQEQTAQERLKAYSNPDPAVLTLTVDDKGAETLARIDLGTHPDLITQWGKPAPLRLAALLPASTSAMFAVRFTPETKAQWEKAWTESVPPEAGSQPGVAQGLGMAKLVASLIGEELAFGVTGAQNGLPQAIFLLDLANVDQAKGMLAMFGVPMQPVETYAEVEILTLPLPLPTPVYMAFPGTRFILANDLAQLKATIDLAKSGSKSAFFDSLDPALNPDTPRYGVFLVKSALASEVIKPVLETNQPLDPELAPMLDKTIEVFKEFRATQEVADNWLEGRLAIRLN